MWSDGVGVGVMWWGGMMVEYMLDIWNWSLGRRWDANFGVPLAFGRLVRGVCWCSAVPSFRSLFLLSLRRSATVL